MGKEGAVEDMPQKIEKKNKSRSKKCEKNEESAVMETKLMRRLENDDIAEIKKHRKRVKEKKKNMGITESKEVDVEKKRAKESKYVSGEDVNEDGIDNAERKRKKRERKNKKEKKEKAMRNLKDGDIESVADKEDGKEVGAHSENGEVERMKRRREKKRSKDESEKVVKTSNGAHNEDFTERAKKKSKKKKRTREEIIEGNVQSSEYDENVSEKHERKKKKEKKYKHNEYYENDSATPNKSDKKVRFSGEDEVFTLPDDTNRLVGGYGEDGLLRGKRFTPEEDGIIKEAVFKYIRENDLGDEGLNMVLNAKKHYKLNGCWKEIGSAIPYRPYLASYHRAQVLFRRSKERKWTQEEYEIVLNYQKEHGNRWRALADELGKHRWHVKDTWRRIKLQDTKKGHWSQDEYQKLFDLVNTDLKLKVAEEKKSKHGMLRDNITWGAISDELSTRSQATCCIKWYGQLTSRMVAEGVWADTDDYRLIGALYNLDATCMEDVDWDDLIEHRNGDLCRKRWNQMFLHVGHHGSKLFAEQVELLAKRYCPHLLEAREIWDSKPRVP